MKLLITGSNGLLGQKIVNQSIEKNVSFIATSLGNNRNSNCPDENYISLDIRDLDSIRNIFRKHNPTHVIHTAAMTNVDECELNPSECQEINVLATNKFWTACKECNIHFQLLSTDFIFDGVKGNYSETDLPNPLSVYAKSKVDAEAILINDSNKNWSIVRTIIVYGQGDNLSRTNIICWAKEMLEKKQSMSIIDDQFRAPTWADDLAWACIQICSLNKLGIYHICGPEIMSVYELVCRVAKYFNFNIDLIQKTDSSTLNQPAKRPPKTGFDLSKSTKELGYKPKTLEQTLGLLK